MSKLLSSDWFIPSFVSVAFVLLIVLLVGEIRETSENCQWMEIHRQDGVSVGRFAVKGRVRLSENTLTVWDDDDGVEHRMILGSCWVTFEPREVEEKR